MVPAIAAAIVLVSGSAPTDDQSDCQLPGSEYLAEDAWLGNAPTLRDEWEFFGKRCFRSVPSNQPHATLRLRDEQDGFPGGLKLLLLIDGELVELGKRLKGELRVTPEGHCIRVVLFGKLQGEYVEMSIAFFETSTLTTADEHEIRLNSQAAWIDAPSVNYERAAYDYGRRAHRIDSERDGRGGRRLVQRGYGECLAEIAARRGLRGAGQALTVRTGPSAGVPAAPVLRALDALSRVSLPSVQAAGVSYASEDRDWGIAPTTRPRLAQFHAPTPRTIPGGRVIRTLDLQALLSANKAVLVVDVVGGETRETIPDAVWIPGLGDGELSEPTEIFLSGVLAEVTGDTKSRPLVFMCVSSQCWLSYNAGLWAIAAGYTDVIWYRGGNEAWEAAGLPIRQATLAW